MSELGDLKKILDESEFLKVKSGDTVLFGIDEIAKVLTFTGGERDPLAPTLFQVANVDSGEVHWVHGEEVKGFVSTKKTDEHTKT